MTCNTKRIAIAHRGNRDVGINRPALCNRRTITRSGDTQIGGMPRRASGSALRQRHTIAGAHRRNRTCAFVARQIECCTITGPARHGRGISNLFACDRRRQGLRISASLCSRETVIRSPHRHTR